MIDNQVFENKYSGSFKFLYNLEDILSGKAMLQKITIQNFRSLKKVSLNLQDVNVLIGANNSGKTNLLKAFEFLKKWFLDEIYRNNWESGIYGMSYQRKIQNQSLISILPDNFITFTLTHQIDELPQKFEDVFQLEIRAIIEQRISANEFIGRWKETRNSTQIFRNEDSNFISNNFSGSSSKNTERTTIRWKRNNNFDLQESSALELELGEIFKTLTIYQPDSSKLTKPTPLPLDPIISVKADASNLVAFLDNMIGSYRKIFNQIEDDLKQCINEFEEINLQTVNLDSYEREQFGKDANKIFKKIGLTDKNGNTYWAEELSEGTLYFLALLAIIHQPNPPKLLLLEEPERGIHPRRIKEVMDFIFRLVSEKQIQVILTTHSPIVLDCFRDFPEKVFVFDKDEEGATQIKNLETDILIPLEEKEIANGLEPSDYTRSMGTNWEAGFFGGVPKNIKVPAK